MAHTDFEILAPGGDIDSVLAAIAAGADAVYCGLDRFNARNRAVNIVFDELKALLPIAHEQGTKIFLTLNIMFLESEFSALVRLLNQLSQTSLDGIIVQDLGLAYLIKQHFPHFSMHASTQMNSLNIGQIDALSVLGFDRLNLARELTEKEIVPLCAYAREKDMDAEIFIHGSYCISFSGLCYASSVRNGASGNRGRCSQPCRDTYKPTALGIKHPLNMKDNSAFLKTEALKNTGAYSFKIEGRIKGAHYVYHAVKTWQEQLKKCYRGETNSEDMTPLYQVFNRDFSAGYLENKINSAMFIDNPRDYSADYLIKNKDLILEDAKKAVYDKKTQIIKEVKNKIAPLYKKMLSDTDDLLAQKRKFFELPKCSGRGVTAALTRKKPRTTILIDSPLLLKKADLAVKFAEKDAILAPILKQIDWEVSNVFYQMPAHFSGVFDEFVALFLANRQVIPYFPAVLIGDDYEKACTFLQKVKPTCIVSNNLGLGYYAAQQDIDWVAGPELNTANNLALRCLQENFGACGAFISDELSRIQMLRIAAPNNFALYYDLYHPIRLMTSRQCFSLSEKGCTKGRRKVTRACLADCEQQGRLENTNGETYLIDKRKGHYNQLVYNKACLNDEILVDLPEFFSHIMLDFTEVSERLTMLTNQEYQKGV